jgi:hypothetical protein
MLHCQLLPNLLLEKINVIILHQILAKHLLPLLALIVKVATFSLDHNKALLELGTVKCLKLELTSFHCNFKRIVF